MTLHCNLCVFLFELLSLNMQLPIKFFTVLLNNLLYMITCKSFRIFYEPEDARWSSSENLFIVIDTTFRKNETSRIIVYIETICPNYFYCLFLISRSLRLSNLITRIAMNLKISVLVIFVEAIVYWLLNNLGDCTFKQTCS